MYSFSVNEQGKRSIMLQIKQARSKQYSTFPTMVVCLTTVFKMCTG